MYQIGGDPDISEDTLEAGDDGLHKEDALGVNEVCPTSNESTQIWSMESSKISCQTTTPKRLCTRETVLTPASTKRRLFPPSPLSECSELDSLSSIFDGDEEKENKEPSGMERSTSPCPPYRHRKRVTAIRVPRTPTLLDEEESKQSLEDNKDGLMRPLTPSRRAEPTRRSPSPSKIPVKASKPFATPDKKPSSAVNSLLLARTPENVSDTSKLRTGLLRLEVPKPVTEPRHSRRKTYSPEWSRYWQGAEADDKPERGSEKRGMKDEHVSLSVLRQSPEKLNRLQQFDGPSDSPLQGRINPPLFRRGSAVNFELGEKDCYSFIGSPGEAIDKLGQHGSPSEDDLVLQSPSTSSQLSMPWNSAEDLIQKDESAYASQYPRHPLAPKSLPNLEYNNGIVYMAFPNDVMEGVFVCDATLHLKVSNPGHAQNEISIRCANARLREPFNLKWGAQYSPTKSFVPAPKLSLVKHLADDTVKEPASEGLIEVGSEDTDNVQKGDGTQGPSSTQREEPTQDALEEELDDPRAPNFQDVVAHFQILLTALGILLYLSGTVLLDRLRNWRPRWMETWRRNRGQWRNWSRARWLLISTIAFLIGTIFMFDERCQTELNDPMYAFHAFRVGYNPEVHRFRPLEPSESCTRWLRGLQAIHGLFGDEEMVRERYGGVYSTMPTYVRRTAAAGEQNSMAPRRSSAIGRTPVPTLENTSIKAVEPAKITPIKKESDKPAEPDFRCLQIRAFDLENVTCVINSTCSVVIPRSAHHEEGFTLKGWIEKHHPEVFGISPGKTERLNQEADTKAQDEVPDVPQEEPKQDPDEKEENKDTGEEEIPIRDKIDYFLGWRGIN